MKKSLAVETKNAKTAEIKKPKLRTLNTDKLQGVIGGSGHSAISRSW